MTLGEWSYLSALIGISVLYLGDSINSCTAAVRELLQVTRKDKPLLPTTLLRHASTKPAGSKLPISRAPRLRSATVRRPIPAPVTPT